MPEQFHYLTIEETARMLTVASEHLEPGRSTVVALRDDTEPDYRVWTDYQDRVRPEVLQMGLRQIIGLGENRPTTGEANDPLLRSLLDSREPVAEGGELPFLETPFRTGDVSMVLTYHAQSRMGSGFTHTWHFTRQFRPEGEVRNG